MEFLIIILAFFFTLAMCAGLILMKWIISQIGVTIFCLLLFWVIAVFLLAMGDENYDE